MIKVVRIPSDETDKQKVKDTIATFNKWLVPDKFEVDKVFTINSGQNTYANCSISCDIETQELILSKGAISFGKSVCKTYELFEVLQCNNCSRFGHISINCPNTAACRKCGGPHRHTNCDATELKCVNCEFANITFEKNYSTNHNSAIDRCPQQLERINAIKSLALPKYSA